MLAIFLKFNRGLCFDFLVAFVCFTLKCYLGCCLYYFLTSHRLNLTFQRSKGEREERMTTGFTLFWRVGGVRGVGGGEYPSSSSHASSLRHRNLHCFIFAGWNSWSLLGGETVSYFRKQSQDEDNWSEWRSKLNTPVVELQVQESYLKINLEPRIKKEIWFQLKGPYGRFSSI